MCVISPSSGTVWGFGTAAGTPYYKLSFSGSTLTLTESTGPATATATITASTVHVVTAVKTATSITLRVDGAQISTTAISPSVTPYTTFCVGAVNVGGAATLNYNGVLGKLVVYPGQADVLQVETEFLVQAGVIRGTTSGTNSGF